MAIKLHYIVYFFIRLENFCKKLIKKQFYCVNDFALSLCGTVKGTFPAFKSMLHCEK